MVRRFLGDVNMNSGAGSGSDESDPTVVPAVQAHDQGTKMSGDEQMVKRHKPNYALADTHTCILPVKHYFTVFGLDQNPVFIKLMTNSIYDYMVSEFKNIVPTMVKRTLYNGLYKGDNSAITSGTSYINPAYGADISIDPGLNGNKERPYWRNYFARMYKHYHVISTEMSLTCQNQSNTPYQLGILQFSDETTPPNLVQKTNATQGITMEIFDSWKHTQREYMPGAEWNTGDQSKGRKTIRKVIKSGTAPVEAIELHTVSNNTVQSHTWTAVGAQPQHKEYIQLYLWSDLLSQHETSVINFELNLKFLVQFRDLRKHLEFITGFAGNDEYEIQNEALDNKPVPEFGDIVPERTIAQ